MQLLCKLLLVCLSIIWILFDGICRNLFPWFDDEHGSLLLAPCARFHWCQGTTWETDWKKVWRNFRLLYFGKTLMMVEGDRWLLVTWYIYEYSNIFVKRQVYTYPSCLCRHFCRLGRGEKGDLVTSGVYSIVRHPMYTGLLTFFWFNPTMVC